MKEMGCERFSHTCRKQGKRLCAAYLKIAKKWNYSSSPLRAQLMFANKQIVFAFEQKVHVHVFIANDAVILSKGLPDLGRVKGPPFLPLLHSSFCYTEI